MEDTELLERARAAVERSYAPYSEYRVGAALATADGTVFTGCNVENANYSNSVHAEELALSKAVAAGHRSFDRIAVSSDRRDGVTPCGMCRQSRRPELTAMRSNDRWPAATAFDNASSSACTLLE